MAKGIATKIESDNLCYVYYFRCIFEMFQKSVLPKYIKYPFAYVSKKNKLNKHSFKDFIR